MERRRPRKIATRPLVLIVESHEDMRALYAIALSSMGFDVIAEANVVDAFGRAWQTQPDIIVTERTARQQDGLTLLHDLKQDPRTRDIPVVEMTADRQPHALAVELRHVLDRQSL